MNRLFLAANRLFLRTQQSAPDAEWERRGRRLIFILSMTAGACGAIVLGQDASWDVLNYHFYSGFALLHKPLNFDFAPAQVQSFLNPLMHVFSYLMLAHLPSRLVTAILGALHGLNFYLIFQISQVLFRNWTNPSRFLLSLCNAAAGCYGAIFILELGTTFGDNLSSILILSGLLLIFRRLQSETDPAPVPDYTLGIAGAILGVTFGIKFTVAIYVAAIAVALSVFLFVSGRRLRLLLIFFGSMGIGFIAAYGFWAYGLYREYQNPVFPYLNTLFRSPYYELRNVNDARFFPRTWQQTFFYPFFFTSKNQLVSEIGFRDVRLALCYLAFIALLIAGLVRCLGSLFKAGNKPGAHPQSRSLLFLTLFFGVSYVIWEYQFSVYRYLIVLELLAPVFLALALSRFFRRKSLAFALSLILNAGICLCVIPADFGRQKFDDEFLKVEVPKIPGLENSVVLMGGEEATSYIIPSFPASTQFVRVTSNFLYPGRNPGLDHRIRAILTKYDAEHTFVFIAREEGKKPVGRDVRFYGVNLDEQSCRPLNSRTPMDGLLCSTKKSPQPSEEIASSSAAGALAFVEIAGARLLVSPASPVINDMIQFRLIGLNFKSIDVLYTINGERQPPAKNWNLDRRRSVRFPVTAVTPKGLYHFIGIRDSGARDSNRWIKVDTLVPIRLDGMP